MYSKILREKSELSSSTKHEFSRISVKVQVEFFDVHSELYPKIGCNGIPSPGQNFFILIVTDYLWGL